MGERLRVRDPEFKPSINVFQTIVDGVEVYLENDISGVCKNLVKAELIRDVVGNKPNFNPVSHVRVNQLPGNPGPYVEYDALGNHVTTVVSNGSFVPGQIRYSTEPFLSELGDLGSPNGFMPAGEAGEFVRKAFDKALDQIPESVSIMNFLIELRDFRNILPKNLDFATLSDAFLSWEFGVSPLISDIKKLLTLIADVNERLEHLAKVNNRTVTISHMHTYTFSDDSPADYTGRPGPGHWASPCANELCRSKLSYYECKARINMRVHYALDLSGVDTFLRAMCSALGLLNPAKIVWNAIPFSFVVDWLIQFGDWLDANTEMQPFQGTISILGVDFSAKTKKFYGNWYPSYYHPLFGGQMNQYSTTLLRGFYRRHGVPEQTIVTDGLTPHQQALALALVNSGAGQRHRRRRRK